MTRWLPPATALAGLVLLGAGSAHAQSETSVVANIPFDFEVGPAQMPAGWYEIRYDSADVPSVLIIRNRDGHHQALALTEPVDTKPTTSARLVFDKEGSNYVLHEVFGPDARVGLELNERHSGD
jgi:hypothetical protein